MLAEVTAPVPPLLPRLPPTRAAILSLSLMLTRQSLSDHFTLIGLHVWLGSITRNTIGVAGAKELAAALKTNSTLADLT